MEFFKTMFKFKFALVGAVLSLIITYGFFAFVLGNFDPLTWQKQERTLYIVVAIVIWELLPIAIKVYTPKEKQDEKNHW